MRKDSLIIKIGISVLERPDNSDNAFWKRYIRSSIGSAGANPGLDDQISIYG
jgi:hypothetical protein